MRIQKPTITQITELKGDGASLTGSFSGSFNTWEGISGKPDPILSSSAQIASDISGSLSTAHVNTKVPGLLSGSAQIADNISGSFTLLSASIASDIAGLDGNYATDAELLAATASLSASLATDIATNKNNISANDTDISGLNSYTSSLKSAITVAGSDTTILGNLTVQGTQTQLQTATLNVEDLNITVASGSATAAAANGAGLTVAGAGATLTYASTGDKWVFNKVVDVPTSGILINGTAVTSTAAELNLLDGSSAGTVVNSKGVVYGASGEVNATTLQIGGVSLDNDLATFALPASTTISAFGATLVDDADAATAIATLGLDADIATLSLPASTTISAFGATLVDDADAATARGTLGLTTTSDVQFDSLGVGTAAPGTTGVIRATNDIVAYYSSDERLKDNITTLDGALAKVNAMRGVEFDWNDKQEVHEGHDIGVVAQEVQAQYPELVHERDNGYLAVDYVKLTAVLLQAVKELSAKVDELSK